MSQRKAQVCGSDALHCKLHRNLKILIAVSKRLADPSFKGGLVVGNVAAFWQPRFVKPIDRSGF
jgi:hypothetical protein